jgi:hypothetical protein
VDEDLLILNLSDLKQVVIIFAPPYIFLNSADDDGFLTDIKIPPANPKQPKTSKDAPKNIVPKAL